MHLSDWLLRSYSIQITYLSRTMKMNYKAYVVHFASFHIEKKKDSSKFPNEAPTHSIPIARMLDKKK